MAKFLLGFLLLTSTYAGWSQQADTDHTAFQIGEINYFGYGGVDLAAVRAQMPLHIGDKLTFASFSEDPINASIQRATGHAPTDIGIVCCDDASRLLIFIGLGGSSSRALPLAPTPKGGDHLDPAALKLYRQEMTVLLQAVSGGDSSEDDSQGYMLSNDPALHPINVSMREYALHREDEFTRVLRNASQPEQRRAAAALLGYVIRSPTQAAALLQAMNDPDGEVRNNAVRALEVLCSAKGGIPIEIDSQPLIALLFSGRWTDRNKASLLLMGLTEGRNPKLLETLREQALEPLAEGASWVGDPGHSSPFLVVLGRIVGIEEAKLQKMIANGETMAIVDGARNAGKKH